VRKTKGLSRRTIIIEDHPCRAKTEREAMSDVDQTQPIPHPRQIIRLSINGRKAIAIQPEDAATIISELAAALASGEDCEIEVEI
jgi:hypothetical protein